MKQFLLFHPQLCQILTKLFLPCYIFNITTNKYYYPHHCETSRNNSLCLYMSIASAWPPKQKACKALHHTPDLETRWSALHHVTADIGKSTTGFLDRGYILTSRLGHTASPQPAMPKRMRLLRRVGLMCSCLTSSFLTFIHFVEGEAKPWSGQERLCGGLW